MRKWSNIDVYLPYYLGFVRWMMFVLLKLIACIFYKQYNMKMIERQMEKEEKHNTALKNDAFVVDFYKEIDVTVVIPVYQPPICFKKNILSIAKNNPFEIIIIADITCYDDIVKQINEIDVQNVSVRIISETRPGKRPAMEKGLRETRSRLICYTDDDVQWCDNFLQNLVVPFNLKSIGGVGSTQIMRSASEDRKPNLYELMADFRLSIRYIENRAMTTVDKGSSCISGRTACYKTEIIQCADFYYKFLNEYFFGMLLASGDDKFITRYIIYKGYKTYHQLGSDCTLTTTFESGMKHVKQMLRWSRNTARSDFTLLFLERKIWRNNPYTAFILFDKLFTPLYMIYSIVLIPVLSILQRDYVLFCGWFIWLIFSRGLKLLHHFIRKPKDIVYLPVFVLYQYFLMFIRIYSIFTINLRAWGTRDVTVNKNNEIVRTGDNSEVNSSGFNSRNSENDISDIENDIISNTPRENDYDGDSEQSTNSQKLFFNSLSKKNGPSAKVYPKPQKNMQNKMYTIEL